MFNRKVLLAAVFTLALAVAAGAALFGQPGAHYPQQAELSVQNLTCGACVGRVQRSLAAVDGVGKADVNITTGSVLVGYDPAHIDPERIAAVISDAGYPAAVRQVLSAEASLALQEEALRLSADYVGRVGGRLVPKGDFEEEVQRMKSLLPPQHADMSEEPIKRMLWQNVVQREILLAEADRRDVVVQESEIAGEIEKVRSEAADFQALLVRFGGEEGLARRVKEGLIVDRLLQQQQGDLSPEQAQVEVERWFRTLSGTTKVEIFDPVLKMAFGGGGGGCGGCN